MVSRSESVRSGVPRERSKPALPWAPSLDLSGCPRVVTLHEAAKRIGLLKRSRTNWNARLLILCEQGNIDVRGDDNGTPCIHSADLRKLAGLVAKHFNRPRLAALRNSRRAPYKKVSDGDGG